MPRISVIVPARDVGDYLGPLLGDLRAQTLTDIEVLVVDDASTDHTPDVIQRLADDDRRFQLIDGGGRGSSVARNLGADLSSGAFLAFVDADDRLSPRYLEVLHGSLVETGSDLACGNVRRLEDFRTHGSVLHRHACAEPERATHVSRAPQLVWDTTIWNKLIRRELWTSNDLAFEEGRWINDLYPSLLAHVRARQVDVLEDVLYYWRIRTDPITSITDSKFADPDARRKSLEDRFRALEQARQLLVDELPVPEVLRHFDEKVLLHDLRTYLPFYTEADEEYRDLLVSRTSRLLTRFEIRPEQFAVGPLLGSVYAAVLDEDHRRLERLLDPDTRVVAKARWGRLRTRTELARPDGRPATPRRDGVRALRDRLPSSRTVEARIDRVGLTAGNPYATISGVVRIRDGRSDLDGPWTAAGLLIGASSGARVVGSRVAIEPPPDRALHPLHRSGWRHFAATVDLTRLTFHATEERWRLRIEVALAGAGLTADTTLTPAAAHCLAFGIPIDDDADLIPVATRSERLELRREIVHARLVGVHPRADGAAALKLDPSPGIDLDPMRLWLQTPRGERRTDAVPATEAMPLARALDDRPRRWELWSRVADGEPRRVRAHPDLQTTRVGAGDGDRTEVVVRPTVRGRVVVERRPAQLELRWVEAGSDPDTLIIGGSGDPAELARSLALELRCRWSDEHLSVPVEQRGGGWQAAVPAARLPGGTADAPLARRWSMHLADDEGVHLPLRVPAEGREHFPLMDEACAIPIHVGIGVRGRPHLWALPDEGWGRWPALRRIERFGSGVTGG